MNSDETQDEPWEDRYASVWMTERLAELLTQVDDTGFAPDAVSVANQATILLGDWMDALVVICRDYDFSWEDIASGLSISRQAAWNRWREMAPERTHDSAVIELLVGIGADRHLKRRAVDERELQTMIAEAGERVGDREATIRYIERRARERRDQA
jgi:hypothetical protein